MTTFAQRIPQNYGKDLCCKQLDKVWQFQADLDALNWADTCLLVLTCGHSAHTEAGWMKGAGKRTIVYIPEMQEAELMYKLFDLVSDNIDEINNFLNT